MCLTPGQITPSIETQFLMSPPGTRFGESGYLIGRIMRQPLLMTLLGLFLFAIGVHAMPPAEQPVAAKTLTVDEARGRAELLHETFHATLQFVHSEYYRPNERLPLPATTLQRVFDELADSHQVKLRWLAVSARAMNVEHEPQDEFEKQSVATLKTGKTEWESVEQGVYRRAAAITLSSECLKCHLPGRTSTQDRAAALVISIPLQSRAVQPALPPAAR